MTREPIFYGCTTHAGWDAPTQNGVRQLFLSSAVLDMTYLGMGKLVQEPHTDECRIQLLLSNPALLPASQG